MMHASYSLLIGLTLALPTKAASYLLVCGPGSCIMPDGTAQPAGTARERFSADPAAMLTPPPSFQVVADDGRALYVPMSTVAATAAQMARVQSAVAAIVAANPLTSVAPGVTGHITAAKLDGTTADIVPTIAGDASGTAAATAVAVQRPAYTSVAVASGATVQLPSGYAYYDLTGSGLISAATVRLPANPQDKQTARLITMGTLQITTMTVQDANGVAVGSTLGIGVGATALYQFQGAAWVRVGS